MNTKQLIERLTEDTKFGNLDWHSSEYGKLTELPAVDGAGNLIYQGADGRWGGTPAKAPARLGTESFFLRMPDGVSVLVKRNPDKTHTLVAQLGHGQPQVEVSDPGAGGLVAGLFSAAKLKEIEARTFPSTPGLSDLNVVEEETYDGLSV